MKRTSVFCLWILLSSILISCSQENLNNDTEIENLRTFAKLYGHVRFFHPSDRASAVDWDRFAIHGVQSVKNATTQKELRNRLENLFYPIAPTVQVYSSDKNPPEKKTVPTSSDTAGFKLVAWQHQGFGFGSSEVYKSIRLNRPVEDPAKPLFEQRPEAGKVVEKTSAEDCLRRSQLRSTAKGGKLCVLMMPLP